MRKSNSIRKAEMVEFAEHMMMEGGITNVTIKAIAERSGFSEAAVYRHFKDKQSLLHAVADDLEQRLFQAFEEAIQGIDSPLDRLAHIMETHLRFTERRRGGLFVVIAACIHGDNEPLRKRMLSLMDRYVARIATLLEECREKNLLRADVDIQECSFLFFGMVQNAAIYFALTDYKSKPIGHYQAFWDTFLRGIVR